MLEGVHGIARRPKWLEQRSKEASGRSWGQRGDGERLCEASGVVVRTLALAQCKIAPPEGSEQRRLIQVFTGTLWV